MIAAIIVVALVSVVGMGAIAVALSRHSERGWERAAEAERSIRESQTARITTLENRLFSHSWGEFASLQSVPDETAKAAWAEREHAASVRFPESFGLTEDEVNEERFRSEGSDLEGSEVFEGPTVG